MYLSEYNETFPLNGVLMPKSGIPIMYNTSQSPDADPKFMATVQTNPDRWRLEFGALWPYMGGATVIQAGSPSARG